MKFLEATTLLEKFLTTIKVKGAFGFITKEEIKPTEIFKNPTSSEMEAIFKADKFGRAARIAVDKGNVYAWDSNVLHSVMAKHQNIFSTDIGFVIMKENPTISTINFMPDNLPDSKKKQVFTAIKKRFPKVRKIIQQLTGKEWPIEELTK